MSQGELGERGSWGTLWKGGAVERVELWKGDATGVGRSDLLAFEHLLVGEARR